ncbi:MAG: mismatch repair protein MutL [Nitrospirae bacterium]|nr:mismatch repair protein MutL [Nitrospirota bacterium]
MPQIRILSTDLRNKIAAGEVIERPASVLKELIENAIDAESSEITVEVLNGGKRMIKVSDNGSGMDKEDALLSFEPHATSKISSFDDLFDIRSLGFRGEALPSIASVSKVKLVTGLKGSSSGISIEIDGGKVKEIRDSPLAGTSFEVRDLFYNTPARKKFLKTTSTELFHIIDTLTKEALSHHQIGFSLLTDNQETMNLPKASGHRERLTQVFGNEFVTGLIEVNSASDGMELSAFVSNSGNFRNSKSHQYIFINRRPIKDASVSHAVYKAYEGVLPNDKHPIFFIFLTLDPGRVDFNVHPTKREVRFEDKEAIYRFINSRLRDRIKEDRTEYARQFTEVPGEDHETSFFQRYSNHVTSTLPQGTSLVSENLEMTYRTALPFIYLGDTFVAVSGRGGLTIVDHHAAHERILYEKLLDGLPSMTRQLLFPRQVRVSAKEYRVLLENRGMLDTFGFEIDDFGNATVIVRTVPDEFDDHDLTGILSDIAAGFIEPNTSFPSLRDNIAARIACHRSIRGKKILSQEELSELLDNLEKTEHPDQCPHGRPTRIFYSLHDLNKLFKRK